MTRLHELDVLRGKVDDAVVGPTGVVAARRGMIVKVGAHPAGGGDEAGAAETFIEAYPPGR